MNFGLARTVIMQTFRETTAKLYRDVMFRRGGAERLFFGPNAILGIFPEPPPTIPLIL